MEELRDRAARDRAVEEALRLAGLGVRLGRVGEGEHVGRVEDVPVLVAVARRLREAVVEGAAPGARHLDEDAVEDAPPLLVLVHALVQEVAEEAAALGDAVAEGEGDAGQGVGRSGLVLEEADEVAGGGEAAAHHARVAAAVDDLVDPARLEAAVERDPLLAHEPPARAGKKPRRVQAAVAHVQPGVGAVGIDRGIGGVVLVAQGGLGRPLVRRSRPTSRGPVIGRPWSVAIGARSLRTPGRSGTSHCQPIQASEKPCSISHPSPKSAGSRGSTDASAYCSRRRMPLPPRFGTS